MALTAAPNILRHLVLLLITVTLFPDLQVVYFRDIAEACKTLVIFCRDFLSNSQTEHLGFLEQRDSIRKL